MSLYKEGDKLSSREIEPPLNKKTTSQFLSRNINRLAIEAHFMKTLPCNYPPSRTTKNDATYSISQINDNDHGNKYDTN